MSAPDHVVADRLKLILDTAKALMEFDHEMSKSTALASANIIVNDALRAAK